jgi:hypothetical protein
MERYALPAPQEAFALLRDASQRFNIKLRTLADAVVRTPGPDPHTDVWFRDRARGGPPALPGLAMDPSGRDNQGAVLNAVLRRVLTVTGAGMGNVQLAEHGRLRLVKHVGLRVLRDIGGTAGHWLAWHRRTVVLDALEYLRVTARVRRSAPEGGPVRRAGD